jgi:hypothetical protein
MAPGSGLPLTGREFQILVNSRYRLTREFEPSASTDGLAMSDSSVAAT